MVDRIQIEKKFSLPTNNPAFPGGRATTFYIQDAVDQTVQEYEKTGGTIDYNDLIITMRFSYTHIHVCLDFNKSQ